MSANRYWAFISYTHTDEVVTTWLHRALETYRLPQIGSEPVRMLDWTLYQARHWTPGRRLASTGAD